MRNILLLLGLLFFKSTVSQTPYIKADQYKVVSEVTVKHRIDYSCYKYAERGLYVPPVDIIKTFTEIGGCAIYEGNEQPPRPLCNRKVGYSYIKDNNCSLVGGDNLSLKIIKGTNEVYLASYPLTLTELPKGSTKIYRDSTYIINSSSIANRKFFSSIYQRGPQNWEDYFNDWRAQDFESDVENFTTRPIKTEIFRQIFNIPLAQSDETQVTYPELPDNSERYILTTRLRINPATENSLILPTQDRINISQFTLLSYKPIWQFKDPVLNTWRNVQTAFVHDSYYDLSGNLQLRNSATIEVSAEDLFGDNFFTYLNKTVYFRTTNSSETEFSNIIAFNVYLSSPHIVSVAPKNLDCNKSGKGELKINFDRPLLSGERLNIFLNESTRRVDFSKLNIQSLDADNFYTYTGLSAGTYKINLLGKYADGLVSDLNVDIRDPLVSEYEALNTINFNNGFNTFATDNFTAYTDYTSYASVTYTGDVKHSALASITEPFAVSALVSVKDTVSCKGKPTGSVNIDAWGGNKEAFSSTSTTVPHYYKYSYRKDGVADFSPWVDFSSSTLAFNAATNTYAVKQTIQAMFAGKYIFKIRDKYDCFTMDANGNERLDTVIITEPEKGITLDVLDISPITTHDAANAMAIIKISGGTQWPLAAAGVENPKPDYYTNIELSYNNNILQHGVQYTQTSVDGVYSIVTNNQLAAGNYLLKLTDKNGCIFEKSFTIVNPEVLVATISKRQQVTCHGDMDAALAASAAGGVQDAEHPVTFYWFRVSGESGDVPLPENTEIPPKVRGNLAEGLAAGTYKVKAVDRFNNIAWETFVVEDPTALTVTTTSTKASCYSSDDGTMRVLTVTGGTPYNEWEGRLFTYDYEWSNGSLVPIVTRVRGGDYVVVVKDSLGCIGTQTQVVEAAARVISTQTVQPITCFGSNNGQITLTATGGTTTATSPYTYLWNTGATTPTLSSLAPGEYWYKVIDANTCYDSVGIKLEQPESFTPVVEAERKLCIGQTIRLDASVPGVIAPLTYSWQQPGGGTSNESTIDITAPGLYTVTVANASGCTKSASINIVPQNNAITTEFVVSTQAFKNDKVLLVNLSQPNDQTQVEWLLPQSNGRFITFASQSIRNCELVFSDTGRFAITMRVHYASGCVDEVVKYVNVIEKATIVNPGSGAEAFLKLYSVYPNPNNGTFTVKLKFSQATRAKMRLINTANNVTVNTREITINDAQVNIDHTELYNVSNVIFSEGVYALVIDTPKGDFVYKVVITR